MPDIGRRSIGETAPQVTAADPIASAIEQHLAAFLASPNFAGSFATDNVARVSAGLEPYSAPEYTEAARAAIRAVLENTEIDRVRFEKADVYLWARAQPIAASVIDGVNMRSNAISDEEWAAKTAQFNSASAGVFAISVAEYRRRSLRLFAQYEILSHLANGKAH